MICKKCGNEISDNSTFCSHCGCDLRKATPSNHNKTEEQIPLLILINHVMKHKIAAIVSLVIIVIAFVGYSANQKHREKIKAETAFMLELNHLMDIVGTYKNSDITLKLQIDNTAEITYNLGRSSWNEKTVRGYWREKSSGLIEIEFSESLKDIYIGFKKRSYCSTLYLDGKTLWESITAYRSNDYSACEHLTKE